MLEVEAAVLSQRSQSSSLSAVRAVVTETLLLDGPGPGEVLVRVEAVGLCHSDLSVINGARPRPLPMVLGHEGAGVVESVGDGVEDVRVGDQVVFSFVPSCGNCVLCLSGRPALCEAGAHSNGAGTLLSGRRPFSRADRTRVNHQLGVSCLAERTVVASNSVVVIGQPLNPIKAALFGCALLTGIGAVMNTARMPVGSTAAVFGLGGVGMAAVIGAVLAGASTIVAVDPVQSKLDQALELGATHAVLASPTSAEEVVTVTKGGADFTFEAVGSGSVMAAAYAATARGGTTVVIGLPHPDQRLDVAAVSVVAEERRILGSYMGSAVPRRDIPRLVALHRGGRLPLDALLSATLAPGQINEGFDALAKGNVIRQVVVYSH